MVFGDQVLGELLQLLPVHLEQRLCGTEREGAGHRSGHGSDVSRGHTCIEGTKGRSQVRSKDYSAS